MRRSICYCEPTYALAGQINTWSFIYTISSPLSKGTLLKFDLFSDQETDWQIPNTSPTATSNSIYALLDKGKPFFPKEITVKGRNNPQYEFVLPENLDVGATITIVLGAPKGKERTVKNGNKAQTTTQRRKSFYLYVDSSKKGQYSDPEVFTLDVRGNSLKNIKIIVPSFVVKNKRFDVIARFEDEYGNLTNNAPENTLIELTYENIRENLNWKLFVPETGFISLPNLYFNEPGMYTITLTNLLNKEAFNSPPICCFNDSKNLLFWGRVRGLLNRSKEGENIENYIRNVRDEIADNFYVSSPFENIEETSGELWKHYMQNIAEFEEANRFTTFLGFQWAGVPKEEGARQIIFAKDNKQLIRKKDAKGNTLKKLYKNFSPKEIISIPILTMSEEFEFNFENFDPEVERVVEIYNSWGSSECSEKEGNTFPVNQKKPSKDAIDGSIIKALNKNNRFGFVAGGYDDKGFFAEFLQNSHKQYNEGLTGILASELNRTTLFESLYQRACYATSGEKIIVGYEIAGFIMGSEVSTLDKPGLLVNRHINVFAAGTQPITKIEIIRNGKVLYSHIPKEKNRYQQFTYDDMESLESILIDNKDKKPPFVYYYVRVLQEDGHVAWASPVWIDYFYLSPAERKARRMVKPIKQMSAIDSFKDDEDFDIPSEELDEEEDDFDNIDDSELDDEE